MDLFIPFQHDPRAKLVAAKEQDQLDGAHRSLHCHLLIDSMTRLVLSEVVVLCRSGDCNFLNIITMMIFQLDNFRCPLRTWCPTHSA